MRFVNLSRLLLVIASSAFFAVGCVGDEPDSDDEDVDVQSDELTSEHASPPRTNNLHVLMVDVAGESEAAPFDAPGGQRMEPTPTPWDPGVQPPPDSNPSPGPGPGHSPSPSPTPT